MAPRHFSPANLALRPPSPSCPKPIPCRFPNHHQQILQNCTDSAPRGLAYLMQHHDTCYLSPPRKLACWLFPARFFSAAKPTGTKPSPTVITSVLCKFSSLAAVPLGGGHPAVAAIFTRATSYKLDCGLFSISTDCLSPPRYCRSSESWFAAGRWWLARE